MRIITYQEGEIIEEVATDSLDKIAAIVDKDVANMLSAAILFFSIALALFAFFLIVRQWKNGRAKKKNGESDEESQSLFISMVKAFESLLVRLDKVDSIDEKLEETRQNEIKLVDVLSQLLDSGAKEHNVFLQKMNEVLSVQVQTVKQLEKVEQAIGTMTDDIRPLIKDLVEQIASGLQVTIDPEQVKEITDNVSESVSTQIKSDIAEHTDIIITAINKVVGNSDISKITKEKDKKEK